MAQQLIREASPGISSSSNGVSHASLVIIQLIHPEPLCVARAAAMEGPSHLAEEAAVWQGPVWQPKATESTSRQKAGYVVGLLQPPLRSHPPYPCVGLFPRPLRPVRREFQWALLTAGRSLASQELLNHLLAAHEGSHMERAPCGAVLCIQAPSQCREPSRCPCLDVEANSLTTFKLPFRQAAWSAEVPLPDPMAL